MSTIRKQVDISREHAAKLKRLAAARGCTESEVVRDAIEALPDSEPAWVQRLRERGLLVETNVPRSTRQEREALLAALHEQLLASGANPRITAAILEERDESDRVL